MIPMSRPDSLDRDHGLAIQSAASDMVLAAELRTLRGEVETLSKIVGLLLDANVAGHRLDPESEPLHGLLAAMPTHGPSGGLIVGTVKCPECGAAVNDELGKTTERCVFCGAEVHTER